MQSAASFVIFALGYLAFGIAAIIWISKKRKAGEKISLRAKIIIAAVMLSSSSVLLSMIELSPASSVAYYVKSGSANVRECPQISCKVIGTYPKNTKLTFPGDLFDKYPDWVEVTFPDGSVGYVSKTVLSSELSSIAPAEPSTQGNGIFLGTGDFEPLVVGYTYGFSFCVPDSARSGATCGGLAGATQSPVGGSPPYSLVKGSGFFPPGMSFELNGLLSGSPTTEGTYNFQICAKDLSMNQGCQNYTLVVVKEEASPYSGPVSPISPPPIITEETPRTVSITSASCEFIGFNDKLSEEKEPFFRAEVHGTVSGPVDSWLYLDFGNFAAGSWSLPGSEGQIWKPSFCPTLDSIMNSNWTVDYSGVNIERKADDPETTTWTLIDPCLSRSGTIKIEVLLYPNSSGDQMPEAAASTMSCSF